MIEVRIRRVGDDPVHLCTWPVGDLDQLIPTLTSWSIDGEQPELTGQFSVGDASAFFEVTIYEEATP